MYPVSTYISINTSILIIYMIYGYTYMYMLDIFQGKLAFMENCIVSATMVMAFPTYSHHRDSQ